MEFGANNIKRSANKIVVAEFDKNNLNTPTAETVDEDKLPLIVVDNEGNIVTEI